MNDAQDHNTAAETDFAQRMGKLRTRFASKLFIRIARATDALPRMSGDGSDAVVAVTDVYREFHDVCGIAPTIGFAATGQLARQCDAILVSPFSEQRALFENERVMLTEKIEALRLGALAEIKIVTPKAELNR